MATLGDQSQFVCGNLTSICYNAIILWLLSRISRVLKPHDSANTMLLNKKQKSNNEGMYATESLGVDPSNQPFTEASEIWHFSVTVNIHICESVIPRD